MRVLFADRRWRSPRGLFSRFSGLFGGFLFIGGESFWVGGVEAVFDLPLTDVLPNAFFGEFIASSGTALRPFEEAFKVDFIHPTHHNIEYFLIGNGSADGFLANSKQISGL